MSEQSSIKKLLSYLNPLLCVFWLSVGGWVITYNVMDKLPLLQDIQPDLYKEPLQEYVTADEYKINFREKSTRIQPVAEYDIWGLVVSDNNPRAWYKLGMEDVDNKLNLRDLCIVWGKNLETPDYMKGAFSNTETWCYWKWGSNNFNDAQISNNHLVSDNDNIRKYIEKVKVGDQIHIKGKLINYSEENWGGNYRTTSRVRTDFRGGACEIIYVNQIKIIRAKNHGLVKANKVFLWLAILALIANFVRRRISGDYIND